MSSKKKSSKQQKHPAKEAKKTSNNRKLIKIVFFVCFFGLLVFIDVQKHGSWKDSVLANALKDYHVSEYSNKVLNKTSEGIRWVNSEIDKQFPGYEKKLHEILDPYSELVSDLGLITYRIILNAQESLLTIYGNLMKKVEEYAPGLLDQIGDAISSAYDNLTGFTKKGLKYLREEVFVGNLAPQHMGKVLIEFCNAGVKKVNEFYVWVHEKVRTVIK